MGTLEKLCSEFYRKYNYNIVLNEKHNNTEYSIEFSIYQLDKEDKIVRAAGIVVCDYDSSAIKIDFNELLTINLYKEINEIVLAAMIEVRNKALNTK